MRNLVLKLTSFLIHPLTVAAGFAGAIAILYLFEKQPTHMPFVALCVLALACVLLTATKKPAFSFHAAAGLSLLLCVVSTIKYRMKGFDLHVYDFFFTGSDSAAFRFLADEYAYLIAPVVVSAAAGAGFLALIACLEVKSRMTRAYGLAGLVATAVALPVSYPLAENEPRYFHYLGGFNASSFFVSLLDLQYLSRQTELAERLSTVPPQPPFARDAVCKPLADSPDVFVVLSESQTNPAYFPQLRTGRSVADSYRSGDGEQRELLVETFGGGTWVTNLSVMTGLSSADFGAQSPYLTILLEGRVGGSIPEMLAECGYRTVAITPMAHSFVNEGPFLESIGIETVLDYHAIGASAYIHRDQFYFAAAEKLIAEHRKSDRRPLFLAMQTMFAHSPYIDELTRGMQPVGLTLAVQPELNEYLRRLLISRHDFHAFLKEREEAPSPRGSVVLEFGDHQSFATKHLVDELAGEQSLADLRSIAYKTYYSLHAFGYEPAQAHPRLAAIDVGFLGASFLEWGRLPVSPMFRSLIELRDRCEGKFHLCPDRQAVDLHLKRRVDSGLLEIF